MAKGRRYRVIKPIPKVVLSNPMENIILFGKRPNVGDVVILVDIHRRFDSNTYYFIYEGGGKEFWVEAITDKAVLRYLHEL